MDPARRWDAVFFCSGAAALVYQVVWMRLCTRLFGSDASGAACVLAVTMAGLGLGARWAAAPVARAERPRRVYAALAVFVAAWAAASPELLARIDPVRSLGARWGIAALALLPPCLAMGATFPLMGRLVLSAPERDGAGVASFYGANTIGAAAGALAAPFAFLPWLGLAGTLRAGAVLDLLAGAGALLLPALGRPALHPRALPSPDAPRGRALRSAGRFHAASAALGFTGLALEVLWTRLLVSVTGASVYAFALVLTVFLAGIGLGGLQGKQSLQDASRAPAVLARCALWIPALTALGGVALRFQLGEADLFGSLANRLPSGAGTLRLWLSHALFAGLALFPPAFLLGLALPAAAAAILDAPDRTGPRERALGRLYGWNTLGSAAGSLAAAFVLLPALGLRYGWLAALLPALAAGALLRAVRPRESLVAAAAWVLPAILLLQAGPTARVLVQEIGRESTAAVEESPDGHLALRVDGKVVASTAPVDLRLQRLLGHVPGLLHGDVRTALVIGLGTGTTAGSLLELPELERLDVLELSGAVVRAASAFAAWNAGVLADPRAHVRLADGRHALAISERRWDLVTADPIHPWTRGSSDLYSLEHFREIAGHLAEGGIASQWLPLYQLSSDDVRTIVATWCAAFPHASAWLTAYDLVLVGALAPHAPLDTEEPFPPRVAASLREAGIDSPAELAALKVADDAELRALARGVPPMTADRPRLEFSAPKSYLAGYSKEILEWAAREDFVLSLPPAARSAARDVRAALRTFLAELPEGAERAARRYGERLTARP